ncbi:MAG TPA: alpha/beta hydrolase [Edaphobacter sp.]|jgi:pimeloyl-ACP methyl ester carboxylesterase|nr:alpha/beta hydrolase [Edaphobacter sp.]
MKVALRFVALLVLLCVVAGGVFYFNPIWVGDLHLRFYLWRAGVKSAYVEAGGYRMHYFEALPLDGTAGTPLLLVHGLGARGEDWEAMIPALAARGFHVYAPDLLGFGRSPRPDVTYSISMQETAVVQFMQAIHLARADVGGWSMGGWVSLKLALEHPELVNRLVVYDSVGIYFPATFGPELFVPGDVAGVRKLMKTLSPKPMEMPDFVAKAALRKLQENGWVINRSMASMMSGRDLLDFRLHNIQKPTLIVWGAQDELVPLSVGETIHRGIPNSVLTVVQGCGHLAPLECAKPVVESTVEFLRAEPPMQGGEKMLPSEK